jgi:hypothetical protein
MKFLKFFAAVILCLVIFFPRPTRAVIPPDFIFNIGSTVIQVFSIIVLFFSAVFGVAYRYLKVRFATLFSSKLFLVLMILVLIIGSGAGAFWYASQKEKAAFASWLQRSRYTSSSIPTTTVRYYFYDRLILHGFDKERKPFLLYFDGSRKQLNGIYGHTYSAYLVYQGRVYQDYTSFTSSSSTLVRSGFLLDLVHTKPNELPEESYSLTLSLQGKKITAQIPHVQAEFLVKNNLEYLRYVSPTTATVTIDNERIETNVMVDRVLSTDAALVTLEDFPGIKNRTHSIVFWDERQNFYHLDSSEVFTPNVPYYPHTWILYKNSDGTMRQSQTSTVHLTPPQSSSPEWSLSLPELNHADAVIKVIRFTDRGNNSFSGIVEGSITDSFGTRKVHGYGFYEDRR